MVVKRGFMHIYTGDGKGKTTAALGIILRAVGAGNHVFLAQFLKIGNYSEIKAIGNFKKYVTVKQFGLKRKIGSPFTKKDREAALRGLEEVRRSVSSIKYELVVLDELNIVLKNQLISREACIELIRSFPVETELVITGRYAPDWIIEMADLVTEMKKIKHYMDVGIKARRGIEY